MEVGMTFIRRKIRQMFARKVAQVKTVMLCR